MPLTHERIFRVRHYECDAYGHVNNVNYLRYMQEAAFDASAAAGYGLERYAAMGHHWVVRESSLDYLQPARYGDTVKVKTWVADMRRVRSRRMYELSDAATGERLARGHTDWVYVDRATLRPATIPAALAEAFFPEGAPPALPREPMPEPPPPPAGVFSLREPVRWRDLDAERHVNNAAYAVYAENCGFDVMRAFGWSVERMTAEGFAILPRRHQIEYLVPAVMGDEVEVTTWASDVKRATALRHYLITRVSDGARLARLRSLYVWVDAATGRPIRIPAGFLADFAPNFAAQAEEA